MSSQESAGLGHLFAALAGADRALTVQGHSSAVSPHAAAVLTTTHLSLPPPVLADGSASRLGRAMLAHAAAHLRHSPWAADPGRRKPLGLLVASALEDARVERLMVSQYPGVLGWWLPWLAQATAQDHLGVPGLMAGLARALLDRCYQTDDYWVSKARQGFEDVVGVHGLTDPEAFRPLASVLANDLGQMRVRFEPRQYREPVAYRDDNTCLWRLGAHADAADHELEQPVPPPPSGIGADPDSRPAAVQTLQFLYPEWDDRLARYRPDWCTVTEHRPTASWEEVAPVGQALKVGRIASQGRRLERRGRLPLRHEGDDLDMDALVRVWTERGHGQQTVPRVFRPPSLAPQPLSLLVLLDLSESTNDPAPGGEVSVLSVEKTAALSLAHSLRAAHDRVAIHGFRSDTRHRVDYLRLLDADVALDARATVVITQAVAQGSTRMGAALRHAASALSLEPTALRAVLLVTDGAPSDVDVYRADPLVEDAAMAVRNARATDVAVYGLLLDPQADGYASRIFGQRGYEVVERPGALLPAMHRLWRRMQA